MYTKGDFHIHTTASDGKYSPYDVVKLAKEENLDIISITDHDTIEGLDEALYSGQKHNIKIIPGIELSTTYKDSNIHVLGYFKSIPDKNNTLNTFLKDKKHFRKIRAKKMINKLKEIYNINLDFNKILDDSKGILARPHIAKAIIDAGYTYTWNDIFNNLIGDNCPAYVPNKKLPTKEGIELLKKSGALTVLAHPVLIKNIEIKELMKLDFDGIEAIYYINSKNDTRKFKSIASKYNKLITAGSDFHGIDNSDNKHAPKLGNIYLDQDNIKTFLNNLK